ncbi:nuclear transport factor 2 family protein [Rhodococcus koreensis]|uniref:nuclear transport factor 2 family protein n=1 Tax=Rhodococcus koreensis TaxID=99653 RepID=UPI001F128BE7|nr:nuclear transport factor 2 family protein [Rhodococcus koreensis]
MEALFTPDARVDFGGEGQHHIGHHGVTAADINPDDWIVSGGEATARVIAGAVSEVISVHQGHDPQIELISPNRAVGRWSMYDRLEYGDEVMHGYGHYHEKYERVDGEWKFSALTLTRLRVVWSDKSARYFGALSDRVTMILTRTIEARFPVAILSYWRPDIAATSNITICSKSDPSRTSQRPPGRSSAGSPTHPTHPTGSAPGKSPNRSQHVEIPTSRRPSAQTGLPHRRRRLHSRHTPAHRVRQRSKQHVIGARRHALIREVMFFGQSRENPHFGQNEVGACEVAGRTAGMSPMSRRRRRKNRTLQSSRCWLRATSPSALC